MFGSSPHSSLRLFVQSLTDLDVSRLGIVSSISLSIEYFLLDSDDRPRMRRPESFILKLKNMEPADQP